MDNNPSLSAYWSNTSRVHRNRNTLQTSCAEHDSTAVDQSQQYSVVHITGYTKVWPPSPTGQNNGGGGGGGGGMLDQQNMYHSLVDDQSGGQQMAGTNFHLIAIARIQMTSAPVDLVNSANIEFVTRHDQNGTITFVDQRVTNLLGYQPTDMLKKSLEEFCIPQDQQTLKDNLKHGKRRGQGHLARSRPFGVVKVTWRGQGHLAWSRSLGEVKAIWRGQGHLARSRPLNRILSFQQIFRFALSC